MSKSFRDLVEAINAKQDKEKSELKPRAKGEQEFAADQGYPPKIGGENDKGYPEPGTDKTVNARTAKKSEMHEPPVMGNETGKQPMQGSSKTAEVKTFRDLVASLKQTDGGRGFQIGTGDVKVVRTSPSAVKGVEDSENISENEQSRSWDWQVVHHAHTGRKIGEIRRSPEGWTVRHKNKNWSAEGAHRKDLIDRLHDHHDRNVYEETDELDEALDPLSIGLGAAGAMYIGHKWKQAGKELEATDKAHNDLVHSMINRDVDSHEVVGHRKHKIRYKDGTSAEVRTSGYGTSHIKEMDRDGKVIKRSKVVHNVKKLAKSMQEDFTPPATEAPKPPKVKAPKVVKAPSTQMDEQLAYIAESGKTAMVTFADGDTATISPDIATKMLDTLGALNETNSRRFRDSINANADGFAKMMQFSERY